MAKRFKPNYTNIIFDLERLDTLNEIYLTKYNTFNNLMKWINIETDEGVALLNKIITCKEKIILVLMSNDIVVRDLLKIGLQKNIAEALRKCLIISHEIYNPKHFKL